MTEPRPTWTLTRNNLVELMELIDPSKPHYRSRIPAGPHDLSVEIDGLTIWAHNGMPRTVARFGDTIIRLPGDTFVVEPAEVAEFDDRDYCQACSGTVHTCVCSDQVTPHPSQL
ncbi:hypothetical protein [Kitasatospora sp. NPDC086791]|uniref:hypothetical protein n=1 Tax=Kitasatospora sp. NPDC086791 TaxID=3155178 RepID=UPI0034267C01